jgi:hypothetical protein
VQRKEKNCRRGGVLFSTQINSIMLINSYGAVSCYQVPNGGVFFLNGIYEGKETMPLVFVKRRKI